MRIWDLTFLRGNLENLNKKKGKQSASMPQGMTLADTHSLSLLSAQYQASSMKDDFNLLEVQQSVAIDNCIEHSTMNA